MSTTSLLPETPAAPTRSCPNCLGEGMRTLYEIRGVPVHSVLLMQSPQEAVDYRRGDLELAFCDRCGFLGNASFDPTVHEYGTRCEESQGFSETFNAFARSLAARVVEQYGVRGKTVLEIGCGKGEFLKLLCDLGDNRGIGIDPAYVPERLAGAGHGRLEFIQDLYSERYAHLSADVICCRHTLEHIAPTYEFMTRIRRSIGSRDTLVFFELPDALRVLREGAFWDIYYEHCSYFTPGSLARLFRATGFDVIDLEMDYAGQYILLAARPAGGPTEPRLSLEHDLAEARKAAFLFPHLCASVRQRWRNWIDISARRGQRGVVWGGGSKGVAFLTTLGVGDSIRCLVDVNPYKQGKYLPGTGHEVVAPERLVDVKPDYCIVMNPVYIPEIQAELDRLGVPARLLAV